MHIAGSLHESTHSERKCSTRFDKQFRTTYAEYVINEQELNVSIYSDKYPSTYYTVYCNSIFILYGSLSPILCNTI